MASERIGDDLLSLQQAAGQLSISCRTLRRIIKSGKLNVTMVHKAKKIKKQDLIDYIEKPR